MINFRRTVSTRTLLATGTVLVGLTLLAGCGSTTSNAQGGGGQQGGGTQQGGQGQQGGRRPGVSGEIAEIDGKTMQVQGSSEQTAVTWTAKTVFTSEVRTARSAVATGVCVIVRSTTGASTASPSNPSSPASTVAARTVNVVPATSGTCSAFGGPGGRDGSGLPSGAPSGMPSDGPSGMPSGGTGTGGQGRPGGPGGGRPVAGKVTAVTGSSFTVEVTERTGTGTHATSRAVTVTTDGSTAYTTRKTVTASAAKVGLCANAQGRTDSTGALTATVVALSAKSGGSCSTGFGGTRG